ADLQGPDRGAAVARPRHARVPGLPGSHDGRHRHLPRQPGPGGRGPGEPPRNLPRDRSPLQQPLRAGFPGAEGSLHADPEGQRGRRPEDVEVVRQHDRRLRIARGRAREGHGDGDRSRPRPAAGPGQPRPLQPLSLSRAVLASRRSRGRRPGVPHRRPRLRRLQETPDLKHESGAGADPAKACRAPLAAGRRRPRRAARRGRPGPRRSRGDDGTGPGSGPVESRAMTDETAERALPPINISAFAGPFDLLLHLIRVNEVSITDIPIARITEQYTAYLDAMQELDLDVASEYVALAAELIYIKSRMLLPRPAGAPVEDPRQDLARRLLEYERFKRMAESLHEIDSLRAGLWPRPEMQLPKAGENVTMEVSLFDLIEGFRNV